jgi:hypothetical protein
MKNKLLVNLDILFLLDKTIVNNPYSSENTDNFVFDHLFSDIDYSAKKYLDKLLFLFDIHSGKLTLDDFFIINKCIKHNEIFAKSFFTSLAIEIINIYHNIIDQKLFVVKYTTSDFVIRAIIYLIFKTIIYNFTNIHVLNHKNHIVELFDNIYVKFNEIMVKTNDIKKIKKYFTKNLFDFMRKKKSINNIQSITHQNSQVVSSYIITYKLKKHKNNKVFG